MKTILYIDDDPKMLAIISRRLERMGFKPLEALCGREGINMVQERRPDLTLLDVRLPDISGLDVLKEIIVISTDMPVIMITGYEDYDDCNQFLKAGVFYYLVKPVLQQQLEEVIGKAFDKKAKRQNLEITGVKCFDRLDPVPIQVVAESPAMKEVMAIVERVAPTNITVLIQGETGTGKERISRIIHQRSERRNRRFVAVNCGAIPDTLFESELFGYEKGAFSGAFKRKEGKFELAHGGTMLLDEITSLSYAGQAKLLRVIEERQLQRLGGGKDLHVDIRLIATTNLVCGDEVEKEKFRQDLFQRLKEVLLIVPPLRERKEDIPVLVKCFIDEAGTELKKKVKDISPEAMEIFLKYHWPGNVRELKNVVRNAVLFTESRSITLKDLSPGLLASPEFEGAHDNALEICPYEESRKQHDRVLFSKVLRLTDGDKKKAAELLEISIKTLYRKLNNLRS